MAHWRTCNSYNEIWPKERVPNDVWQSEKRRPSQGLQASQIAEIMKSDQAAQFTKYVYLREVTEQIKKGQSPNRLMLKEPFILRPAAFVLKANDKILGYRDPRCKHENSSTITSVIEMKLMSKLHVVTWS